jgi:hypothetical protein
MSSCDFSCLLVAESGRLDFGRPDYLTYPIAFHLLDACHLRQIQPKKSRGRLQQLFSATSRSGELRV